MNLEELEAALPKAKKGQVNQELLDIINDAEKRGDFEGEFANQVISFQSVLQEGRYKATDYVKAVEFCAYYLNGDEQAEAFVKTFPDKVKRRVLAGLSSYSTGAPSMYFKGQLVQKLIAQMELPDRFFHHNKLNAAINKQYSLMMSPKSSDRIQMECASSLMAYLKAPETSKIELDVSVKKDESAVALEAKLLELATLQVSAFENGVDVKTLQKIAYKEAEDEEFIEAEPE